MNDKNIQYKYLRITSGVNHSTLAKIKKDKYVSLESLEKIARALGVNIGDIVELK